jgi:hypothetical protein
MIVCSLASHLTLTAHPLSSALTGNQTSPTIKRKVISMLSTTKLFHAEIEGYPHMHVFAKGPALAAAQVQAYLYLRKLRAKHYTIEEAVPQNMSRLQREHLAAAVAMNPIGFGFYDPVEGWEIIDVFDYAER